MKLGINTLLWTAGFNETHLPLFPRIKAWGFDGVEVATFAFDNFPARQIANAARDAGLDCTLCSALTGSLSLVGEDPAPARDFLKRGIETAAEMGTSVFVGPFCAPVGQLLGRRRNADEWKRAVDELSSLAPLLESHNVTMAIEPLNRFETYFLNTISDGVDLCRQIGSPRIALLYDTFHANIEEKEPAAAYTAAASHIAHVHTCENDRGIPGSGHVDWPRLFAAIAQSKYDAWLVIESFGFSIPEIATAACIWRDLAPNAEDIASEGVRFLRQFV
ncbi:MAG TPA: sugar phosphate isomerase/epimerase family protein [Bryobacteraceae bacterium]|jgi:D-psicose/D-tagatose/L-ribulose 3-epimerase